MVYNWISPTFYVPGYQNGKPAHRHKLTVHIIKLTAWGMGIFVQARNKNILFDIGANSGSYTDVYDYLVSLGVIKIDLLVFTHPHRDHIGYSATGIQNFMSAFNISEVWNSGHPYPKWFNGETDCPDDADSQEPYNVLLNQLFPSGYTIAEQGVTPTIVGTCIYPYHEPRAGESFEYDDVALDVLNPYELTTPSLNADSLAVKLTYGANKIIILADCNQTSDTSMIARGVDLSADICQIGHHGNDDSLTAAFLNAVDPRYMFVQRGNNTPMHDDTIATIAAKGGITVYNPEESGRAVAFYGNGTVVGVVNTNEYNWQ